MASSSAYKSYEYDSEIGFDVKYKLKDVVQELHAYNSKVNKWKLYPLKEGAFGFDNLVISLCYTLNKVKTKEKLENKDLEKKSIKKNLGRSNEQTVAIRTHSQQSKLKSTKYP